LVPENQGEEQNDRDAGVGHVEIQLDDPDAVVFINGKRTHQKGKVRRYVTPKLGPEEVFHARITVRWNEDEEQVEKDREFTVRPGQVKRFTFKAPSPGGDEPETMQPEQQPLKKNKSDPKSKKSRRPSEEDEPEEQ
jgi:uncharacterized protein (TIGR03000 family)